MLKLRQDTLKRQEEAQGLRNRRNQQLEARIKAARSRNRQRLGLPPEDEEKCEEKDIVITGKIHNSSHELIFYVLQKLKIFLVLF